MSRLPSSSANGVWGSGHEHSVLRPGDRTRNRTTSSPSSCAGRSARCRGSGLAEKLCPCSYPIGTRRLCLDIDYYETYNRDNVTLIDSARTRSVRSPRPVSGPGARHHELDLIVFALGFRAFTGALDRANIRDERGRAPTDGWARGPRTLLGLMTTGFPNLFLPTGPGSPSVLGKPIPPERIPDGLDRRLHRATSTLMASRRSSQARRHRTPGRPRLRRPPAACCASRSTITWSTST